MSTPHKKSVVNHNFFDGINKRVVLFLITGFIGLTIYLVFPQKKNSLLSSFWKVEAFQVGVGSPRLSDVNNDGVDDVIIGAGFEWNETGESSVMAFNGKTGDQLWRTIVPESAYGTPILVDVNDDGIKDATASGRFPDFYMLNGSDGAILWRLSEQNPSIALLPCNFNSPVPLPDMDADGISDLLVTQGGLANKSSVIRIYHPETNELLVDTLDRPYIEGMIQYRMKHETTPSLSFKVCNHSGCEIKTIHRDILRYHSFNSIFAKLSLNQEGPGGRVYVISSATGKILTHFPVPSDRESWSVPIITQIKGEYHAIYGSGGERHHGFIQSQNIQTGTVNWMIPTKMKGVISSPLLIHEGNRQMVVVNSMDGDLFKIDAETGDLEWQVSVGSNYETYSSVAMIRMRDKSYSDIVSVFSYGVWPRYDSATLFIFDGQSGDVLFKKKIGYCNGASSPLIADVDDDTHDDILMVTCTDRQPRLLVINNKNETIFDEPLPSGAYSTPVVSDIDSDGYLDIIVPSFHFITRFTANMKHINPISLPWAEYRGESWTGVVNKP